MIAYPPFVPRRDIAIAEASQYSRHPTFDVLDDSKKGPARRRQGGVKAYPCGRFGAGFGNAPYSCTALRSRR
jgi:hypothetical protein